jgi:hypothetical protein
MLQISSNVQYLFSILLLYRPSMPMAMGAVQVETHRSSFQMQLVKSTIVFIPVACDLFILYTGCIKKNAALEFPKKSLCNSYSKHKRF